MGDVLWEKPPSKGLNTFFVPRNNIPQGLETLLNNIIENNLHKYETMETLLNSITKRKLCQGSWKKKNEERRVECIVQCSDGTRRKPVTFPVPKTCRYCARKRASTYHQTVPTRVSKGSVKREMKPGDSMMASVPWHLLQQGDKLYDKGEHEWGANE